MEYYNENCILPGGVWNIDTEKTAEMVDIGTCIYSACVLIVDKAVFCYSDFPLTQVMNDSV